MNNLDVEILFSTLSKLVYVKDKPEHHPERNVFEHSLQAFEIAKRESNDKNLHMASLFHDIGKVESILAHDKYGVDILKENGYKNETVLWLIQNHIRIIWFLDGAMKKKKKIRELLDHESFDLLVHLRRIDNSARKVDKLTNINYNEIIELIKITNY